MQTRSRKNKNEDTMENKNITSQSNGQESNKEENKATTINGKDKIKSNKGQRRKGINKKQNSAVGEKNPISETKNSKYIL